MSSVVLKIEEIRDEGLRSLYQSLGPAGMIKFIQLFSSGSGNYTEDRDTWLSRYDFESLQEELGPEK